MKQRIKPRQILLSKRANVFYLEHVRVMQKDDRVVYLNYTDTEIDRFFNIPERNTVFILLGKGTSITDSAVRKLAESNVVVGFVGNGGSPLFAGVDYAFLTPQSEYRPTEYMQNWMRMWLDDNKRLQVAKQFLEYRLKFVMSFWANNAELKKQQIAIHQKMIDKFLSKTIATNDTQHLMAVEAEWARNIYRILAQGFRLENFKREEGKQGRESIEDMANSFIDHGNYIAYGYAASALNVLGISFALPVIHGKTRRGALVFDVADLFKDAIIMPLAFYAAKQGWKDQLFRDALIEKCHECDILDVTICTIIETIKKFI
jgi:CRISP-associated protein Cas1